MPSWAARPHGVTQLAVSGSVSLWPFHSAKSRGSCLPRGSESAAGSMSSIFWSDSEPYAGQDFTSK